MMVQCKKTGRWYDPDVEWKKILKEKWFVDVMKRLAKR